MDKINRIQKLHNLLAVARHPVAREILEEKLECSEDTITRIITESRNFLDAPIVYDQQRKGYYYDTKNGHQYELPGLWFNASEMHALLAAYQLLSNVKPGFLEPHIDPLKQRIQTILRKENYDTNNVFDKIRILQIGTREYDQKQFAIVTTALLSQKQLFVHYLGRARNLETQRNLSPQRLIYYRDNWYLDAWCHQREALRSFALDCIQKARLTAEKSKSCSDEELQQHYAGAYGIFGGKATHTAKLRFTPDCARWVAQEQWHPRQNGQYELDGSYVLEIPYSDPRELIMDILKHGANVEVISPAILREEVVKRHQQAYEQYR